MRLHGNARTCPKSRELIARRVLEGGWPLGAAAEAAGVSDPTARKWVRRWAAGDRRLLDRCSAPRRIPHRTPRRRVEAIAALRRLRLTAAEIAAALGMALSTVSVWLKRLGLGKRSRLEPPEPPNRYERRRPGELVHIDVKKLGRIRGVGHRVTGDRGPGKRNRGIGWDFVHVCVDDHTRLAYVEIHPDEHPATAVAFLRRARGWFAQRAVKVERVMTDNGNPYRSQLHKIACRELELKHLRTRPYRPRTNGKAERFIQTLLREWAYGPVYGSTRQRTQALQSWLNHYNYRRPHGSLSHQPPGSRLNNQPRNYT